MNHRTSRMVGAIFAVVLMVLTGLLVAGLTSTASSASAATTSPSNSALSQPVSLTPALKEAVQSHLDSMSTSAAPNVAQAAKTVAPDIYSMSPDQILAQAGLGNELSLINQVYSASVSANSGLSTAWSWNGASWTTYLEVAGVGCVTGGGSAAIGVLGTVGYSSVGWLASADAAVTKTNPAVFGITCAIGAAAALVIFQSAFNQAQAAINYAGLWTKFAAEEWAAFYNYVNLTNAMYASLASGVEFASVAFFRMADNAALLQLQNATFNAGQDLLQSGIAAELAGIATDYQAQLAQDFQNMPMWLDALTAHGAGFDGYGVICVSNPTPTQSCPQTGSGAGFIDPTTNMVATTNGSIVNSTAAGLVISGTGSHPVVTPNVLIDTLSQTQIYLSSIGGTNVTLHIYSPTKTEKPQAWYNATTPTYSKAFTFGLPAGVYNVSVYSAGGSGYVVLPFASNIVSSGEQTVAPTGATFGWSDRYTALAGAQDSSGNNGHGACVYSSVTAGNYSIGTVAGSWDGVSSASSVSELEFDVATGGACQSYVAVGLGIPLAGLTVCQTGSPCYNTATQLPETLGQVEYNATVNAETYWAFIRSLGYTSLSQIPQDCIIPAPYQALPSQVNLGALSLNETMALYLGWLHSMGNFYGSSGTFQVCQTGKTVIGWVWNNETYAFQPGYAEYGGVYLNNGTSPVNPNGNRLSSEVFGTRSSWALPVTPAVVGHNGSEARVVSEQSTSIASVSGLQLANGPMNVPTGDVLLVTAYEYGYAPTAVADSAGNHFKSIGTSANGGHGQTQVWVDNSTTVASATDTITVTFSTNGAQAIVTTAVITGTSATVLAQTEPQYLAAAALLKMGSINQGSTTNLNYAVINLATGSNDSTPVLTGGTTSGLGEQNKTTTGGTFGDVYTFTAAGTPTLSWGYGGDGAANGVGGIDVMILGTGSVPSQAAKNTSLIIVPTLASVVIPQGVNWPVPLDNPLYIFYALHNGTQNQTSKGNWTVLNLVLATGNGTANTTADHYGSSKAGDTVYLTGCEQNYTYTSAACSIAVTNWTVYIIDILCNGACERNVNVCVGGCEIVVTCGAGIFILGYEVDAINGWLGGLASIPILGGIACPLAWGLALIFDLALVLLIAWGVAAVIRAGRRS